MAHSRLALVGTLLLPTAAAACLWDYDTLAQERSRFPTALELITGKYLRHSPEFYAWRVADRRKRLAADPSNLALHDDLVVALDRLGKYDEALAAVEAANKLRPNRYETESNWGTVLLHAGKLDEGLTHIDAAVRINPDAHFGREVYQQKLVRWVLDARKAGRTLPVAEVRTTDDGPAVRDGFAGYLGLTSGRYDPATNRSGELAAGRQAALKGVLGMMRSGQHDNPLLLEALGSLLTDGLTDNPDGDAKQLAGRAYLRAADVVADPTAKANYRRLAERAFDMQTGLSLEQLETDFRRELADADTWYAELRAKEVAWVNDPTVDPDAEFAKLYAADPASIGGDDWLGLSRPLRRNLTFGAVCVGISAVTLAVFGCCVFLVVRRVRRRAKISSRAAGV